MPGRCGLHPGILLSYIWGSAQGVTYIRAMACKHSDYFKHPVSRLMTPLLRRWQDSLGPDSGPAVRPGCGLDPPEAVAPGARLLWAPATAHSRCSACLCTVCLPWTLRPHWEADHSRDRPSNTRFLAGACAGDAGPSKEQPSPSRGSVWWTNRLQAGPLAVQKAESTFGPSPAPRPCAPSRSERRKRLFWRGEDSRSRPPGQWDVKVERLGNGPHGERGQPPSCPRPGRGMGHLDGAPGAGEPRVRGSGRQGQERTEPAPGACRLGALQASVQEQLGFSDVA